MRNLVNGGEAEEFDKAIDLTIYTKCPEKWLLIDMETGQQYLGSPVPNLYGKWRRVNTYKWEEVEVTE
jgi:hypothetical protein